MTKKEIMNVVKNIRNYLMSGNPIWDTDTVNEAMSTAIEALKVDIVHCKECKFWSKNAKDWVQVYEPCCHFEPYDFCSYAERIADE